MKIEKFDYSTPAELYTLRGVNGRRQSMAYRRFETAANAVRYSIEELPESKLPRTTLEVNEKSYRHAEIRELYDSAAYPLERRA